ncbi:MAG: hypothetical protein JWM88_3217, partial [Verrucomicrobia bacterium]|nr:hypothetical protein [Verrucomicrobiota bacterium]
MSTSTYQFFYKHAVNRIVSTFLAVLVAALGTTAGTARADQSVVTTLGGAVSLYGGADGTEPFTYQWRKDGVAISGATSSSFLITSAQVASAGIYTVLISNALGSTLSDIATVSIGASAGTTTTSSTTPAPTPTNPAPVSSTAVAPTVSDPASVTVVAGNSATFSVTAGGSPTPAVHWELSTNGGITYNFLNDDAVFSGTQTSTLTIQKSDSSQNGWLFLCKAINSANSVTSGSATLTVTAIAAPTTTTTPGSTGKSTATNSPPTVTDPSDAATTAGASAT